MERHIYKQELHIALNTVAKILSLQSWSKEIKFLVVFSTGDQVYPPLSP